MRITQLLSFAAGAMLVAIPLQAADPAPAPVDSQPAAEIAAPAPEETLTLEELLEGTRAEDARSEDAPLLLGGWGCPPYSQICTTDVECDAFCGGAGWGECLSFGGVRTCCACNT